jgi:uncharacterized protein YfaQ (DUF2300 family)
VISSVAAMLPTSDAPANALSARVHQISTASVASRPTHCAGERSQRQSRCTSDQPNSVSHMKIRLCGPFHMAAIRAKAYAASQTGSRASPRPRKAARVSTRFAVQKKLNGRSSSARTA